VDVGGKKLVKYRENHHAIRPSRVRGFYTKVFFIAVMRTLKTEPTPFSFASYFKTRKHPNPRSNNCCHQASALSHAATVHPLFSLRFDWTDPVRAHGSHFHNMIVIIILLRIDNFFGIAGVWIEIRHCQLKATYL
jgi:hypothetical protein